MTGGLSAGATYVDVLPNMAKFGPATAAGITKSTAGLGSKLKGALGPLGLTLGAAFAVGFAKSAFAEFETKERSLQLFNSTLERTGQIAAINADEFETWLNDFSGRIGQSDDEIRDLATRLVQAFDFTTLAGDATTNLENIMEAIQNMAVVTGRTDTTMSRMFLTLLNDPARALPILQRFGVVTEEQADTFAEMAEKGEGAAVTTEVLGLVQRKYAGAAEDAATTSGKLSFQWGEFKEVVGEVLAQVLKPLLAVFTTLFSALTKFPGAVDLLTAAVVALGVSILRTKLVAWAGTLGGVGGAAKTASVGVLVLQSAFQKLILTAKIFIALKVLDMLGDIGKSAKEASGELGVSADTIAAIERQTQSFSPGNILHQFADPFADASDKIEGAALAWKIFRDQAIAAGVPVEDLSDAFHDNIGALNANRASQVGWIQAMADQVGVTLNAEGAVEQLTGTMEKSGGAARRAAHSYVRFAGLTQKGFKEWSASVGDNLRSATTSVSGFQKGWEFTAKSFQRTVKQMADRAKDIAKAFKALDREAIPEQFRMWLIEQGPDAVRAFTESGDQAQRETVDNWRIIDRATDATERRVGNLDRTAAALADHQRGAFRAGVDAGTSALGRQANAADTLRSRLEALDGLVIQTRVEVTGGGSGGDDGRTGPPREDFATGGIVTRPTIALIGEAGPEAVIPLSRGGGGEMTLRIVDWRNGIARLGDEQDWNDEGRP